MNHIRAFTAPVALEDTVVAVLARHLAMNILPADEIRDCLGVDARQMDALTADPAFQRLMAAEKRRLLTLEGRREMADWKQTLTEHQYWERMMTMALSDKTSPATVIEALKVAKRPQEKAAAAGVGAMFAISINVPGAAASEVRVAMPVIEGDAA